MNPDYKLNPSYRDIVKRTQEAQEKVDHLRAMRAAGTYVNPQQMSIFDLLPESDWGDATPYPADDSLEQAQHNLRSLQEKKKTLRDTLRNRAQSSEVDHTCVWCGHVASDESSLEAHEEECAP